MASNETNPWVLAQSQLKNILDEHSFKNWFSQTHFQSYEDGTLKVQVPSQFFANWLRDHYMDAVSASLKGILQDFRDVEFVPVAELHDRIENDLGKSPRVQELAKRSRKKIRSVQPRFNGFNERYTFDRFIIGAGNRFAHAAAKAVFDSPARAYNPLFLYGQTGLGKTHLMQAIGQAVLKRDPNANVVFISSEQFTNQLIEAIAKKSTPRFRAKYRQVDLLLIDDIQFIAGKEATQEEFFHTFNELFDRHKQIVLSSDRGPKEIQGLEERLVSRFEWGLVTDIQPPDVETRIAILQNKAVEENITVDQDIMRYIASCVTSNIRELEGAFITVVAYSRMTEQPITLGLVEQVLHDLIGSAKFKPITIEGVQKSVAEHFDVRLSDMRGRSRQRQVAYPRQLAMHLCKELIPSLTLVAIGEAFGGKDHTTVLYACQKIQDEVAEDGHTRQLLSTLEKKIRA
jgi:chromosomal replication initiator protein